jgi:carboxymethylenebutenolidase
VSEEGGAIRGRSPDDVGAVDPTGILLPYGEGDLQTVGYLVQAPEPRAGVVVAHDWYGHLPHLRERCDALAGSGMTALAPDLYGGQLTGDEAEAARLAAELDLGVAIERLLLSMEFLRQRGVDRIGLLGFSLGGRLALRLTGSTPVGVVATVAAYYAALEPVEREPIGCPVQLHYAEQDFWSTPDLPDRYVEWLTAGGTPVEVYRYPGARHGFANANVPVYRPGSAELSWARTVRFLGSHLIWRPP